MVFLKRFNFKVKLAFTLAETLIVLAIIGVVAVLTIPVLMTNINQNVFASAQDLAIKKIRAATDQMRTDDLITGYDTNDHFVDQFQKYYKTVKRCDSAHLRDCFPSTIKTTTGDDLNVSDLVTGVDLGQNNNTSSLVGLELINGISVVLAFKPDCQDIAPSNNTIDTTSCLALVYDLNGFGKPNQVGKDIWLLNANLNTCIKLPGGLCVAAGDITFGPTTEPCMWFSTDMCGGVNYWAGARDTCTALGMRLPTSSELNTMFVNKAALGINPATSTRYMSSSPGDGYSWTFLTQYFNDGEVCGGYTYGQCNSSKSYGGFKARCVK